LKYIAYILYQFKFLFHLTLQSQFPFFKRTLPSSLPLTIDVYGVRRA
jgi:hypothetical protein